MLRKRVISAIIFFLITVTFVLWGSFPFFIFVSIITSLGLREYANLVSDEYFREKYLLIFLGLIMISYTYFSSFGYLDFPPGLIAIFIFLVLFIYHIAFYSYKDIIHKIGTNILGLIYIGGGMSIFLLLRDLSVGNFFETGLLWLVLISTWATDIGAYFTGRQFGSHPLTKNISPNKTIEGAVGGVLFNLTAVIIYSLVINLFSFSWIIYGILSAIIAIIGDLFESSLKRDMEVKDTGDLIPGHGGILDRFDSVIFTGVFTYYFISLLL